MEAKERARVAYARGQAAFASGDYTQALRAFEEAFYSIPNPIVLLSVSESAAKLGNIDAAVAALDKYLALRPDAPDRADVSQKRAALLVSPAHLFVTSAPTGAEVLVDGQVTGKKTPSELDVSPGDHQLQAALPGYESKSLPIHVAAGARVEQALELHAPPPPPSAAVAAPPVALETPAAPPPEVPTTALWVTGSIGAAGLIAGTVLGFLALKEHSDYDSNPSEAAANRGERLALFADVGFGVGAMAVATAAVLYLTHDEVAASAPEASARKRVAPALAAGQLQFVPRLSANSASATARIRF
jgi:tetratricopeptide (TPR) repeat protein